MKRKKRLAILFLVLALIIGLASPATNCASRSIVVNRVPTNQLEMEINFGAFHRHLSSYGHWVNIGNYGPCWRPAGMIVGWRPYFDNGYWTYTRYGWTWVSLDLWGDIVFHYGTWDYDPFYGWIWVPGYVWGPAWVTWIYTDFHIGWAPLPPTFRFHRHHGFTGRPIIVNHNHYNFVFAEDMIVANLHKARIPVERNMEIVRLARPATTISVVNNHVINKGPDLSRVEKIKLMPTPIEKIPHQERIRPRTIELSDQQTDIEISSPNTNRQHAKEVIKDFELQEQKAKQDRNSQVTLDPKIQPTPTDNTQHDQQRIERNKQEQLERSRKQVEQNKQIQQQKQQQKEIEKLRKQEERKQQKIEQERRQQQEILLPQQKQQQRQEKLEHPEKLRKQQERPQQRTERKQGKNQ